MSGKPKVDDLLSQLLQANQLFEENKTKLLAAEQKAKERKTRKPRTDKPLPVYHRRKDEDADPWVLREHYHAHQLNPGFYVPDPKLPDRDKLHVYCHIHKQTHLLKESILVSFGLDGLHWVCRQIADERGYEEYIVK